MRIIDKICEKAKNLCKFAPFVVFLSKIAKGVVSEKKRATMQVKFLKKGEIFYEISEKISGETCGSGESSC